MKVIFLFISVLGALAPSTLFSQGKNRISLQTGLFHCFFDGSSILDNSVKYKNKTLNGLFGGSLNDSRGIQIRRNLNKLYALSLEYMNLNSDYLTTFPLNYNGSPLVYTKSHKIINITCNRSDSIFKKCNVLTGLGVNLYTGLESFLQSNNSAGWGYEAKIIGFKRKDFGLNARIGLEYHPKKWLTLFTNIDFVGIVFLNTTDSKGMNTNTFYKEKYGMKNVPSRTDLSLRFGIGFNF